MTAKRQPSPQQAAVIRWITEGRGSLNLVARAGCGKSTTLMMAVQEIVARGLSGSGVAVMAFNKAIAEEFKGRLTDAGITDWKQARAGTVHSFGYAAWRRIAPAAKIDEKKVRKIIDAFAATNALDGFYGRNAGSIAKLVSLGKQTAFGFGPAITDRTAWFQLIDYHGVNDLADNDTPDQLVDAAIAVYQRSVSQDREVIDFDDMILAPLVHGVRMWQHDWVLIDEAQDTNAARRALALKMLKPRTGRLIACGDDRQAIYGFTGADSDAMELIRQELGSTVLPLTVTYRCPKAVVAEANRLVPDLIAHESAPAGTVRVLPLMNDFLEPGQEPVTRPWFLGERPAKTSAILCRNTKPLIEQAYALIRHGIGCRVEGREIGEGLIQLARRWKRVTALAALIEKLEDYAAREIAKWTAKGREDRAQAIEDKVGTVQEIARQLIGEGKTEVADLVDFVQRLFGDTKPGEEPDVLTLSTIHKSKGREWEVVYLLDRAGTLPSPWARKDWQRHQEANLEYVAITRAKRELVDLVR